MVYFLQVIQFLIFARVVISWVVRQPNDITRMVYKLTEPFLAPFREIQQKLGFAVQLDFSPIFALLVINFLMGFLRY